MLTRICFGAGSGLVTTFFLFLLMQGLIKSERNPFNDVAKGSIVDFVSVVEDKDIRTTTRVKPEPPKPPDEPPPHHPKPEHESSGVVVGSEIVPPATPTNQVIRKSRFVDGKHLPIVKVKPVYPARANGRGIEGYVLLEFTVTRTGAVRDPVVVESAPPGIFDRAAKNAALKFKYRPMIVNGEPVDVSGVLNRITFALQDE